MEAEDRSLLPLPPPFVARHLRTTATGSLRNARTPHRRTQATRLGANFRQPSTLSSASPSVAAGLRRDEIGAPGR